MINAYSTLYRMDIEAVLDNTKYAGMSYRPMSLAEKLGLIKQDNIKEEVKKEDAPKKEVKKEDVPKKEVKKEDAPKKEVKKEDAPKKEVKKEDAPKKEDVKRIIESGVCGIDTDGVKHLCGDNSATLFSILDPQFNLREACKNMILLENSLLYSGDSCQECVLKHALTVEGFLEEASDLDKKKEFKDIIDSTMKDFRKIFKLMIKDMKMGVLDSKKCSELSNEISKIRKPLCKQFGMFM